MRCPEEAFIHSGRPVFDQVVLAALKGKYATEPLRVESDMQVLGSRDNTAGKRQETAGDYLNPRPKCAKKK